MVSGNDGPQSKVESAEAEGQPPSYEGRDGQTPHVREGLYILTNKKARSTLDLSGGDPAPGTHAIGYEQHVDCDNANQLWVLKQEGLNDTYTIRCLLTGTYLDLWAGRSQDGSKVAGGPRGRNPLERANQEWHIKEREPNHYTLQCSRTETFMEIPGGNPKKGVDVKCSKLAEDYDHQLWTLELASRTSAEIKALFGLWKPKLLPQIFSLYGDSAQYFILRNQTRRAIWEATKLARQPVRSHFFDYDDFVIRMKEGVSRWVTDRYKPDIRGYSVLFGVIYGEAQRGPKAYNWYLSPDMCCLVFFDAQSGKEYSSAALDGFGFEPTFATF